MNCKFVKKQMVKFVDKEIDDLEIEICKSHIDNCESCKIFYQKLLDFENSITEINIPLSNKTFENFEKLIPEKRMIPKLSYWLIAASVLFAAIVGTALGIFNELESKEVCLNEYSGNNITYISMIENLE